jgi:hypothetical protein
VRGVRGAREQLAYQVMTKAKRGPFRGDELCFGRSPQQAQHGFVALPGNARDALERKVIAQ